MQEVYTIPIPTSFTNIVQDYIVEIAEEISAIPMSLQFLAHTDQGQYFFE